MSNIRDFFPIVDVCSYVTGDVGVFATDDVPEGFIECDGTALSKSDYPGLYSILGNKYGSGSTWFRVPDYRGLFLRGGNTAGVYQSDTLKAHQHALPRGSSDGYSAGRLDSESRPSSILIGYTGGSETRPKNIYVLYAIKY